MSFTFWVAVFTSYMLKNYVTLASLHPNTICKMPLLKRNRLILYIKIIDFIIMTHGDLLLEKLLLY